MKTKILLILIICLFYGSAFAETVQLEFSVRPKDVIFYQESSKEVLEVSNYLSCGKTAYCRITFTMPDGVGRSYVWGSDDKPVKIKMEGLTKDEYIDFLEQRIGIKQE